MPIDATSNKANVCTNTGRKGRELGGEFILLNIKKESSNSVPPFCPKKKNHSREEKGTPVIQFSLNFSCFACVVT
jgi:hypothetical protein